MQTQSLAGQRSLAWSLLDSVSSAPFQDRKLELRSFPGHCPEQQQAERVLVSWPRVVQSLDLHVSCWRVGWKWEWGVCGVLPTSGVSRGQEEYPDALMLTGPRGRGGLC